MSGRSFSILRRTAALLVLAAATVRVTVVRCPVGVGKSVHGAPVSAPSPLPLAFSPARYALSFLTPLPPITRLATALPPVVFTSPCVASAGCLAGSWPLARPCVCVASRPQACSRKLRCPPARLPQVRGCPRSLRVAPMLAQGGSLAADLPTGACLPCPRGVGWRRSPGAHLQARRGRRPASQRSS